MDEDENAAAKRLADLDKTNADKMRAEYLAAVSLNNLAEAARLAAMGVGSLTLGGVPIQDFAGKAAQGGAAAELLASAVLIESEKALKEAEDSLARSTQAAAQSEAAMGALNPTNYGYTADNPSFTYGQNNAPTFVINAPLGSEDTLTEAIQRALQKLNRYGDSTTFAGAL
jgi:hypothetical protein